MAILLDLMAARLNAVVSSNHAFLEQLEAIQKQVDETSAIIEPSAQQALDITTTTPGLKTITGTSLRQYLHDNLQTHRHRQTQLSNSAQHTMVSLRKQTEEAELTLQQLRILGR